MSPAWPVSLGQGAEPAVKRHRHEPGCGVGGVGGGAGAEPIPQPGAHGFLFVRTFAE